MTTDKQRDVTNVASSNFFATFISVETASGLILVLATICALAWANSPWSGSYQALWHSPSVHFLVNDMLMTLFFLIVGLEIRREVSEGALSSLSAAALPLAGALGGVVAPAAIYLLVNTDPAAREGWAIPTATDIAFAVGVLALLGKRVDPALRAFLLALAIADDVAAILIIAFFYSGGISVLGLGLAAIGLAGLLLLRRFRVRHVTAYLAAGLVLWLGLLTASVHPVLAGVLVGMFMPDPPANTLEHRIHPWVAYGAMPLFALANAGISLTGLDVQSDASLLLVAGIVLGLVVGKPAGIVAATAIAVRLGWCRLPTGVTWSGIFLIGLFAGIGFTMSIFIATLAFPEPAMLAAAKFGVLAGSVVAAVLALAVGRAISR
ncbi:MAG: Na+/H+ antiporter NhaA [Gammaproteobacteria bacterium]